MAISAAAGAHAATLCQSRRVAQQLEEEADTADRATENWRGAHSGVLQALEAAEAALADSEEVALLDEYSAAVREASEARRQLHEAEANHSRIFLRAVAPGAPGGVSMWPDEYFKLPWAEAARELLTREEHTAATAAAAAKAAAKAAAADALEFILSIVLGEASSHPPPASSARESDADASEEDERELRRMRKRRRDSWGPAEDDSDLESDDEDVGEGWGFGCVF